MNLHGYAKQIIPQKRFQYRAYVGMTEGSNGIDTPKYAAQKVGYGSIQPVPKKVYQSLGLNSEKEYILIVTDACINGYADIGDKVTFCNKEYRVMDAEDWRSVSDWAGVMCIHE